jgi:hypothetical protein
VTSRGIALPRVHRANVCAPVPARGAREVSAFEDIPRQIEACYKTARIFSNAAGSVMQARIAETRRLRAIIMTTCLLAATIVALHGTIAHAASVYISGSPSTSVVAGNRYEFTPQASTVSDRRFVIENRPGWASFSSSTGTLSGRPGPEHVTREFNNIKISVVSGTSRASLPAFSIDVKSATSTTTTSTSTSGTTASSVTLSWSPPTENSDGTALTNLAGYRIYSGTSSGGLALRLTLSNPGLSRYVIQSLRTGERFFAVASVSTKGVESALSRVVELN